MNDKLFELAEQLVEIRDLKAKVDLQSKEYGQELAQIENEMLQMMADIEITSFKTKAGVQFTVVKKEHKKANQERKEELYEVMKEKGYNHLFTINANSLVGVLNELKEENEGALPEWLDGLIDINEEQKIRVNR